MDFAFTADFEYPKKAQNEGKTAHERKTPGHRAKADQQADSPKVSLL